VDLCLLCIGAVLALVMQVTTIGFRAVVERVQRRRERIDADQFDECECCGPVLCVAHVKTEEGALAAKES
jgi:hypothetical protein